MEFEHNNRDDIMMKSLYSPLYNEVANGNFLTE